MRKHILILVVLVVLLSLFSTTTDTNFRLWNTPSINTNYIDFPEIPISFNTDISILGLVTNFFTKFELDYLVYNTDLNSRDFPVITKNVEDEIEMIELNEDIVIEESIVTEVAKPINETIYRIQIGAFKKPLSDKVFVGINNIITFMGKDGLVRYIAGSFTEYEDAVDYQAQMKVKGFDDCYIIVDNNDKTSKYVESNLDFEIEEEVVLAYDDVSEINDVTKESIVEEVIRDEIEESIVEEVIRDKVEQPIVNEVVKNPVVKEVFEEDSLPSDKEIILQHPNIKENAKIIILEALEEGYLTMDDVFDLLNEYAGKDLNKKKVKRFIKKTRK